LTQELTHMFGYNLPTHGHDKESEYRRGFETFLDDLGYDKLDNAPVEERAKCDIYLENLRTGHKFVTDVMITHPGFGHEPCRHNKLWAAKKGETDKIVRYAANYYISNHDVIPLVFETYGGYAPSTFKFLKEISLTIAQDDEDIAGRIFRHLRDRIAVALHVGHGQLISELNTRNYAGPSSRR